MTKSVEFKRIAKQLIDDVVRTAEYFRHALGFEIPGYLANLPVFAMVGRGAADMPFGKANCKAQ